MIFRYGVNCRRYSAGETNYNLQKFSKRMIFIRKKKFKKVGTLIADSHCRKKKISVN
tara:strand:+ start:1536 stop:1706 length:171 start_codon:yes stop_codon:yes gene_type:complete